MNTAIRWIAATGILLAASTAVRGVAAEVEPKWRYTVVNIPRAERVPVKDILQQIAAQAELNLAFDFDSLAYAEALDKRIDANFPSISAGDALALVLKSVEWNYEALGNTLLLKSNACETASKEVSYEVGDLVVTRGKDKSKEKDLIELITSTVAPVTWDVNGGLGKIGLEKDGSRLVVNQPADVQREIADLLKQLRKLQFAGLPREALRRKVNLSLQDVPLTRVLAEISEQCGANIYLSPECEVARVSIEMKDGTAGEALEKVLKPLKLRQKFEHQALLITADKNLFTVTYPVGDLVRGGGEQAPDFESLVRRVKANVLPGSWQKLPVWGNQINQIETRSTEHASVEGFATNLSLIVRQNEEGQELVQAYLKKLRAGN